MLSEKRYFEKAEKGKSLKPKTKKALEELYRPQKELKPKDEIEEILAESPEFATLTEEELEKEKKIIEEELVKKEDKTEQTPKENSKKTDDGKGNVQR